MYENWKGHEYYGFYFIKMREKDFFSIFYLSIGKYLLVHIPMSYIL